LQKYSKVQAERQEGNVGKPDELGSRWKNGLV
jgi:hypothetical protein